MASRVPVGKSGGAAEARRAAMQRKRQGAQNVAIMAPSVVDLKSLPLLRPRRRRDFKSKTTLVSMLASVLSIPKFA
jgi:hypothetical protein